MKSAEMQTLRNPNLQLVLHAQPLTSLTCFNLFIFDFGHWSDLLILKLLGELGKMMEIKRPHEDHFDVRVKSFFKMAVCGGHLQMCWNMCIMD